MHTRSLALATLGLSLAVASARAQPRPPRAPHPVCTASHHPLTSADPDVIAAINAFDPAAPVRMVLTDDGALVFLRTREGALTLLRLDPALRAVVSARELSLPAGDFVVTRNRASVAVAYVENNREIVFARLSPAGEARNVPRVLARTASTVSALALSRTDTGYVLAWTRAGTLGVDVLVTDRHGLPEGASHTQGEGISVSLAWLDDMATPVLLSRPAGSPDALATLLNRGGRAASTYRWPAGTLGPVEWDGALYAVQRGPALSRIPASGPSLTDPTPSPDTLVPIEFSRGTRGVAVLLRDPRTDHAAVTLTAPDTVAPAAATVRYALPGTLSARDDGTAVLLAREPAAHSTSRLSMVVVTCPEPLRGR